MFGVSESVPLVEDLAVFDHEQASHVLALKILVQGQLPIVCLKLNAAQWSQFSWQSLWGITGMDFSDIPQSIDVAKARHLLVGSPTANPVWTAQVIGVVCRVDRRGFCVGEQRCGEQQSGNDEPAEVESVSHARSPIDAVRTFKHITLSSAAVQYDSAIVRAMLRLCRKRSACRL